MAANIHIQPKNLWEYVQSNSDELMENSVIVAENPTTGYEVCVTKDFAYSGRLIVYKGDDEIENTFIAGEENCKKTMLDFLIKYIYPAASFTESKPATTPPVAPVSKSKKGEKMTPDERETEVHAAMLELIKVVLCTDDENVVKKLLGSGAVADCADTFCYFMTEQYGVEVYYPTVVTEDNGTVCLIEYPFSKPTE